MSWPSRQRPVWWIWWQQPSSSVLGRRSETYRGLTEEPDERFALIRQRAWAGTGVVLTLVLPWTP
jgi:hypothetical protein